MLITNHSIPSRTKNTLGHCGSSIRTVFIMDYSSVFLVTFGENEGVY